ncbi:MAG: hypothetical protein AB1486_27535 [Planctomycetota bacterium]
MMSPSRARPWRVVLIVEDDSDGRALRKLADASGLAANFDWLPANGIGDIKRKGDALIELARDRIESKRGRVAVLVDRDGKDRRKDEPHRTISRTCATKRIPYIEAVEAFEAWCLADQGIANWLGVKTSAHTDGLSDPKHVVARAFRKKTGRPYQKLRSRVQLVEKATGIVASRSSSWTSAVAHLSQCPLEGMQ